MYIGERTGYGCYLLSRRAVECVNNGRRQTAVFIYGVKHGDKRTAAYVVTNAVNAAVGTETFKQNAV